MGVAKELMEKNLKKKKKCQVYGVEERGAEADIASKKLTGIIVGDIENEKTIIDIKKKTNNKLFDAILATSVIEHLKFPEKFLLNARQLLKTHAKIIVTTPNIAHWSTRIELLKGNFDYEDYGIMDRTHLHFFTPKTFKNLFIKSGYKIINYSIDDVGGGYPKISQFLSRFFPSLFTYQMLIIAQKK